MEIKTNFAFFPNVSFEFDATGMYINVTINITPNIKQYLSVNNVFKGEQYWVYRVRKHLESYQINKKNVETTHRYLLNNAMIACRKAKQEYLQRQINNLQENNLKL